MKVQEVIWRAMGKRITWWQAAEIIGISDRQMRRWRRPVLFTEMGFPSVQGGARQPWNERSPLSWT